MSECIDCLHYEACKDIHDILDTACSGEFDYEALARGCKNFTDRSEWEHIPYKVGDSIFCDGKLFADHCAGEVMEFTKGGCKNGQRGMF